MELCDWINLSHVRDQEIKIKHPELSDGLCGIVVRVSGYRSRGHGWPVGRLAGWPGGRMAAKPVTKLSYMGKMLAKC
jgi:hypothetical protein